MSTLSKTELKKAHDFYRELRLHDDKLYRIQSEFCALINQKAGVSPVNNGSFGLLLNLDSSDLDLAVGVTEQNICHVRKIMSELGQFVAVRQSTYDTVRHVFRFFQNGVEIDLGILPLQDFELTIQGMYKCRSEMTLLERIEHVWTKKLLLDRGQLEKYANYKLEPYKRFFSPRFIFSPIVEPSRDIDSIKK